MKIRLLLLLITLFNLTSCHKKWEGYSRSDFTFKDREVILVKPKSPAEGNPWIWRPAFFGIDASVDIALLEQGFYVVYYDLTHLYGSPNAVALGNDFYKYMIESEKLSPKVTLEGLSRGGLFVFNWAAQNPEKVACIYADAPVCDLKSWPGRQNEGLWKDVLSEWNLQDSEMDTFAENPIDKASIIGKYKIPVIVVYGDADSIVPPKDNIERMRDSLSHYGAEIHLIVKKGVGHNPHSLKDPSEIVDFITKHN